MGRFMDPESAAPDFLYKGVCHFPHWDKLCNYEQPKHGGGTVVRISGKKRENSPFLHSGWGNRVQLKMRQGCQMAVIG